jgi:hypothetical protein
VDIKDKELFEKFLEVPENKAISILVSEIGNVLRGFQDKIDFLSDKISHLESDVRNLQEEQ